MSTPLSIRAPLAKDLLLLYRKLLEDRFGLLLTEHQAMGLDQKVLELLALTDFTEPLEMCRAFAAGWRADLLQVLVAGITVGETHFFRISPQVEALRLLVLPALLKQRAQQRTLRIWSAGCSTGEEPYTVAILLRELLAHSEDWNLQVLASDISGPAIETARRGVYREWSFRDTPSTVRDRYFVAEPPLQWHLVESVRNMVQFSQLNLVEDEPPGTAPLDLILCRNVTIYFGANAVQRVYTRFADRLADDGFLMLGPSDPVPAGAFEPEFVSGAVLWRKLATGASAPLKVHAPIHSEVLPVSARRPRQQVAHVLPKVEEQGLREANPATARAIAEGTAAAEPLNAEAHLLLGMLLIDAGAVDQALPSLRRAVFLSPGDPLSHFTLARACLLAGQPERARAELLDARRQLVSLAEDDLVPNGGGMWAGELRYAVETQLASVG